MNIRAQVVIAGRVQGVFYRATTKDMAKQLGLNGWVKNLSDGRVEAIFEGEKTTIHKIIAWCHQGPPSAKVTDVTVHYSKYLGEFKEFSVTY